MNSLRYCEYNSLHNILLLFLSPTHHKINQHLHSYEAHSKNIVEGYNYDTICHNVNFLKALIIRTVSVFLYNNTVSTYFL